MSRELKYALSVVSLGCAFVSALIAHLLMSDVFTFMGQSQPREMNTMNVIAIPLVTTLSILLIIFTIACLWAVFSLISSAISGKSL